MAEGLTRRFVVKSRDDGAVVIDGSAVRDDLESGRRRGFRSFGGTLSPLPATLSTPSTETTFLSLAGAEEPSDTDGEAERQKERQARRAPSPRSALQSCLAAASTAVAEALPAEAVSCIKCQSRRLAASSLRQSKIQRGGDWEQEWSVVGGCCQCLKSHALEGGDCRGRDGRETTIWRSRTMGGCIRQFASFLGRFCWRETSAIEKKELPWMSSRKTHHHPPHVQPSRSASTQSLLPVVVGRSSLSRPSSPMVDAMETGVVQCPMEETLHNDALVDENQQQLSEKNNEGSISIGQTWETSLETDDSVENFNAPPPVVASTPTVTTTFFRPQSPRHLLDYCLFKVDIQDVHYMPHHPDLDITFLTSLDESESVDEGSNDDNDDASITRSFLKASSEHQASNGVGPTTEDISANTTHDGNNNSSNSNGSNVKMHFYLRLPSAASLKEDQIAKVERAERTADFMETAKALSLTLSRNRSSRRRPQRSTSSTSQTSTTKAAASGGRPSFRSRAESVGTYADGALEGMVDSLRSAPPTRKGSYKIKRQQDMLETMADPATTLDNDSSISTGWGGQFNPPKRQQGYMAPVPIPPLSREESIESLHQLLEQEQSTERRSPVGSSSNFKVWQQPQQQQDSVLLSSSETESALQRRLLGYEEIDVPLRTGDDYVERTNYGNGNPQHMKRNSIRKQRRRQQQQQQHDALGTAEQVQSEEFMAARTHRRRVQRRRSFVSGSKIERFDDQSHQPSSHSSGAMYSMHTGQEELGGGVIRVPATRRSSFCSGSMSIESYNEWKNEMMAQNG
jgi:hypothetical protein